MVNGYGYGTPRPWARALNSRGHMSLLFFSSSLFRGDALFSSPFRDGGSAGDWTIGLLLGGMGMIISSSQMLSIFILLA